MYFNRYTAVFFAALTFSACANTDEDSSPDGEFEQAFTDGKADDFWGSCQSEKVLQLINSTATTADLLKDRGVHTRAANNIIDARNGADGVAGTADDKVFASVVEIDDVPYVGPVAMDSLGALVADLCITPAAAQVEVIFSPQDYQNSHLKKVADLIDQAQDSVDIAMYSYSDAGIGSALERAVDRGVSVRMIFDTANSEKSSPANTKSSRLEDAGVDVRYVNKIMHHKFAIIDGPRNAASANQSTTDNGVLFTGSGNWSHSAGTKYDENTVFVYGNAELNLRYQQEFNTLWGHSRDFEWNTELEFFESDTIDDSMIPDDPSVDAVFTSPNFKQTYSSRYGNTFTTLSGTNTVANRLVEMIEGAEKSIWIASGHLRSRPVSIALMKKVEENPELDVRILLDGQEFIAESTHEIQLRNLDSCIADAAGNTSKENKCFDRGFYFSYSMVEAGIPVKFKYYSYRWHYSYAVQMHHKYFIVDGETVATGSYNLSDNAEHNTFENVVFFEGAQYPELVESFVENFNKLWVLGDEEALYTELMDEVENGTGRVPIVFDSMALSWEQVNDLKRAIVANCSDVNSSSFRSRPERHHSCTRR